MKTDRAGPQRGEIWTADTGHPPKRHWVTVVSLDARNSSDRIDTVLAVPFGSVGVAGPTTLLLQPGETGLPGPSYIKGHFITTVPKAAFRERIRILSNSRMREVVLLIRRSVDPDAPAMQTQVKG